MTKQHLKRLIRQIINEAGIAPRQTPPSQKIWGLYKYHDELLRQGFGGWISFTKAPDDATARRNFKSNGHDISDNFGVKRVDDIDSTKNELIGDIQKLQLQINSDKKALGELKSLVDAANKDAI